MPYNYGKKFEQKFKEDFNKIKESSLIRLRDPTIGFKTISNISDFIAYKFPFVFYIECKSTEGNTFSFLKLTQYEALLQEKGKRGVNPGAII